MRLRNAGRVIATVAAAAVAFATMGGAFATTVDRFNYCMENQSDTESIATRISCCKEAGGAWVELYDPDGNVVDAFCDGAEEVYEPEEVRTLPPVNPAVLDGALSGTLITVASDPSPSPVPAAEIERTTDTDEVAVTGPSVSPTPAPVVEPTPSKVKRKHHNHHPRRHR